MLLPLNSFIQCWGLDVAGPPVSNGSRTSGEQFVEKRKNTGGDKPGSRMNF